jgi:hypothetical protein
VATKEEAMSRLLTLASLSLACAAGAAHADLHTIVGTSFDVVYDDTKLGLFGTPVLAGNVLFFTPNSFSAQSLNGALLSTRNSTISGIELLAKNGNRFDAISLGEAGDYRLSGAGSEVKMDGRLIAFDVNNALQTYTPKPITVSASTPLSLADGLLHDWVASSVVDSSSTSLPTLPFLPPVAGWLDDTARVGITIENLLSAYTAAGIAPSEAFIEKKFTGVGLTISAVPEPATWALLVPGLLLAAVAARRAR